MLLSVNCTGKSKSPESRTFKHSPKMCNFEWNKWCCFDIKRHNENKTEFKFFKIKSFIAIVFSWFFNKFLFTLQKSVATKFLSKIIFFLNFFMRFLKLTSLVRNDRCNFDIPELFPWNSVRSSHSFSIFPRNATKNSIEHHQQFHEEELSERNIVIKTMLSFMKCRSFEAYIFPVYFYPSCSENVFRDLGSSH